MVVIEKDDGTDKTEICQNQQCLLFIGEEGIKKAGWHIKVVVV